MVINNIQTGWCLKGQTLLIAEILQEVESIDGGVMGKGAQTGTLDESLWLQKAKKLRPLSTSMAPVTAL